MKTSVPLNKNTLNSRTYNRISQSLNKNTISQYGKSSAKNSTARQPQRTVQNNAQSVPVQNNRQTVNRTNTPANTPSAPPPRKKHPSPAPDTLKIVRGQKINVVNKNNMPVTNLRIGAGWDILDSRCELDISSFILGENGKILSDEWFVFYGQPVSPDGNVKYITAGNSGDDGIIEVNLARLNPKAQKIVFSVTIYEAFQKKLNFGMVRNVYTRMTDISSNKEILRFELTDCFPNVTAMVVGELYRYKGSWKFNAVGSGVNRDLAEFCGMYGVALT